MFGRVLRLTVSYQLDSDGEYLRISNRVMLTDAMLENRGRPLENLGHPGGNPSNAGES